MGSWPKAKHAKCKHRGQTGIILGLLQLCIAFAAAWSGMNEKRRIQDLRKFWVRHMALTVISPHEGQGRSNASLLQESF